jgi:glyoxylase-like metal-dependent hydrolase (beta-lactamase superfamily II)
MEAVASDGNNSIQGRKRGMKYMANNAIKIHHINCGALHKPPRPRVGCHCLLLEGERGLALVDAGIGLLDVERPVERIGQAAMDMAGFQFAEAETAVRRIEALGFHREDVKDVILSHGDHDHVGGLADFPEATVHVAEEELANIAKGSWRYAPAQFAHNPRWKTCAPSTRQFYGLEARPVALENGADALLVPLFGHTRGHCGVAVRRDDHWAFYVGDAYYLRVELGDGEHPVSLLAEQAADDNKARRESLSHLRRLAHEYENEIDLFSYHDLSEFPGA